jgi:hypothetical protein
MQFLVDCLQAALDVGIAAACDALGMLGVERPANARQETRASAGCSGRLGP